MPSLGRLGTGKSYRAQLVASEKDINYIIDDGLLIKDNEVICGTSAKKAPTKIETVKHALFSKPEQQQEFKKITKKYKPEKILILGTSDSMVQKIAENLGIAPIIETVYIQNVATEEEMKTAKRIRQTEGKHVIPVPTFEIKKEFSGYLLDPLQIFKSKGKNAKPYIAEKSIIRPTFSYLGNFTISDSVFRQIIDYLATRTDSIHRIIKVRIENQIEGMHIYMEISIKYGFNVIETLNQFKSKCKREIENLTAMNVSEIEMVAREIYVEEKNKEE